MPRRLVSSPATGPWNCVGHFDLDLHHRLQQHRLGLQERLAEAVRGRRSGTPCRSCRLRDTSRLRESPSRPRSGTRRPGPCRAMSRKPFSTDGNVFLRNAAADDVLLELEAVFGASSGSGSSLPTMWAYWPEPPVCFLCLKLNSAVLRGRFAVADLRRADFDLDACTRGGSARRRFPGATRPCRR